MEDFRNEYGRELGLSGSNTERTRLELDVEIVSSSYTDVVDYFNLVAVLDLHHMIRQMQL